MSQVDIACVQDAASLQHRRNRDSVHHLFVSRNYRSFVHLILTMCRFGSLLGYASTLYQEKLYLYVPPHRHYHTPA